MNKEWKWWWRWWW